MRTVTHVQPGLVGCPRSRFRDLGMNLGCPTWVPSGQRVFVFAARVGGHEAQAAAGPPRTTALPPAFSIFSTADLENLWAWMMMGAVSSPEPRILISAFLLEARPSFL